MLVVCRLAEIMAARGITVDALHAQTGVGREAIAALRHNKGKHVSRKAIGFICGALNIKLDELFTLVPVDIWAPIKLSREVTIHYGSRAVVEPQYGGADGDAAQSWRQYVGVWDMRTLNLILEYLKRFGDIRVRLEEHITGERGFDPSVRQAVRGIFESGNNVIIGSPIANHFAEEAVCHAYRVAPYAPQMRDKFPYGFVWDSASTATSSFGWRGIGNQFGIASTTTQELVATRTVVPSGEGKDCALILVERIFQPPARRVDNGGEECVVIGIFGHSGAGTYAGAMAAIDAAAAPRLYPPERGKPNLRVVQGTYTCCPAVPPRDTREVTGAVLIDEPPATSRTAPPKADSHPPKGGPSKPRGAAGSTKQQAPKRDRPDDQPSL